MGAKPGRAPQTAALSGAAAAVAAPRSPRRVSVLIAAFPVCAAIAVYLPALANGFVWDDPFVLQQLRAIRTMHDLFVLPPIIPHFYYRPLIFVSYLADRAVGGESPFWFHASVVGWHALNTLLVFLLADALWRDTRVTAAGAALLFAVYPTHAESVAWMAGRSDVIACTFILLTALLFIRGPDARWVPWAGGISYLAGLLAKELALATLVVIPFIDVLRAGRLRWLRYVPLVAATGAYFLLRHQALGTLTGGLPSNATAADVTTNLLAAVGFYVARAVVPMTLNPYIPDVPTNGVYVGLGLAAVLGFVPAVILAWRRGYWPIALLLWWFAATLAPSLGVIVRRSASAPVADRYLYVPTVASCCLLVWCVWHLVPPRARQMAAIAMVGVCAVLGVQATAYSRTWTDNLTFWSYVARRNPDDGLAQRELGAALIERGQLGDAERALQRALNGRSTPEGLAMTYGNLGNLYRRVGRFDDAVTSLESGLRIRQHPGLLHNLGMTLMARAQQGQRAADQTVVLRDVTRARDAFNEALRVGNAPNAPLAFAQEWDAAKTHALLGQVLFALGDREGAGAQFETVLRLQPSGPVADLSREYLDKLSR